FGLGTRWTIRAFLLHAFGPTEGLLALSEMLLVCAGAGLTAGIVSYFICAFYRNSKNGAEGDREKYMGQALAISAIAGFIGGSIGGIAVNLGTFIARSGGLAIGTSIGIVGGLLHVIARNQRVQGAQTRSWGSMILRGAAFGALGGVCGTLSAEVFSIRDSV